MKGAGRIYKRTNCKVWWIAYCHCGKEIRESAADAIHAAAEKKRGKFTDADARSAARKFLEKRVREVANDREGVKAFIGPQQDRLTVKDMLDALESDFKLRGLKSLDKTLGHLRIVRAALGDLRASNVSSATVSRYIEQELEEKKTPGTVNRRTALLGAAFRLAIRRRQINSMPEIPKLPEHNARRGFFEKAEFESVLKHLPEYLKGFVQFGYLCGWRKAEIASLQWADVDMLGKVIRLRSEHSKNGQGRVLALEGELWNIIARQWSSRDYQNSDKTIGISALVFHRKGEPIGDIRKSWKPACKETNVSGKLFHDLRRTAVRNMVRAGVSERVAMSISGHKTRAIFDRYNIVSEDDLRKAMERTQAYLSAVPRHDNVTAFPEGQSEAKEVAVS
jgi:integrase